MTNESLNVAETNTAGANTEKTTVADTTKVVDGTDANQQQPTGGETAAKDNTQNSALAKSDGDTSQDAKKTGEDANKEGEKKADDKKADDKPVPKAPEKYELKIAENVKLTEAVQTQFETIARELDLPQEAAQKMLDLAPELNKMYASQLQEVAQETSNKWHDETRNDKELGGEKYDATMALVAKTRDAFTTPELRSLLQRFDANKNPNGTGLGNHPEVIRLFARIGSRISEDGTFVGGNQTPNNAADPADKLYANTTSKPK